MMSRCYIDLLPDDDQTDGENEYIVPCDKHYDLAPTGVFHRMEMWKHLSPKQFLDVFLCVDEWAKRMGPVMKERNGLDTRTFDIDSCKH